AAAGVAGGRRAGFPKLGDRRRARSAGIHRGRRSIRNEDGATLGVMAGDDAADDSGHDRKFLLNEGPDFVRLTRRGDNVLAAALAAHDPEKRGAGFRIRSCLIKKFAKGSRWPPPTVSSSPP